MIQIYYATTEIMLHDNLDSFIGQLSLQTKSKLSLLKRDEDKHLLLTSLILLSKSLDENGCGDYKLIDLQYSKTGRPFFSDSHFDFNISHTDHCAAVAFSKDCRVGIDIEKIKKIDFSDFTEYFTGEQWDDIYSADDTYKRFYDHWTLLESGIKADGRGVSLLSTKSVILKNGDLFIDSVKWFYQHYDIDQSISCCVTTDKTNKSHEIKNIKSL
jgi:4'-phosphopantetheinyl transferase